MERKWIAVKKFSINVLMAEADNTNVLILQYFQSYIDNFNQPEKTDRYYKFDKIR
jgi:hypothetical protein